MPDAYFSCRRPASSASGRCLPLRTGTVVTRGEEETVRVDAGTIEVVPAWRFLLDLG